MKKWVKRLKLAEALALFLLLVPAYGAASAGKWVIAEGGEARAAVILAEGASAIEHHAAGELVNFLGAVTGAEIRKSNEPVPGKYSIWLGTPGINPQVGSSRLQGRVNSLSDQGFLLHADRNGLIISGKEPLGVLFGTYAFLEEHVGMRWFFPGEDGEYCPDKPDLRIDSVSEVQNPAFKRRDVRLESRTRDSETIDTWDWIARNRMQVRLQRGTTHLHEEQRKRGAYDRAGGHVLVTMVPTALFDEHPEYFPLTDGERMRPPSAQRWNPCTTHPDVINRAVEYMLDWFGENPGGVFHLGNNDYPRFCECENCVALHPPEEQDPGGTMSTRWFTFVNEAAGRVWEVYPDANISTWAYQTYRLPPAGVIPDPRLTVVLCDHHRCHRHSLDDMECEVNQWFRNMFEGWAEMDVRRDNFPYHTGGGGRGGAPLEYVAAKDVLYKHRLGHEYFNMSAPPPDGDYRHIVRRGDDPTPFITDWRRNFIRHYVSAKLAWNPELDIDEIVKDLHMKYYGPAGEPMLAYRTLLRQLWENYPGHHRYGASVPSALARSMSKPNARRDLVSLLDEAKEAASGDSTIEKRVAEDRKFFEESWLAAYRESTESLTRLTRDVTVARRQGGIKIDGVLDEPGWLESERITGFISRDGGLADTQTYVRLLYDDEHLYLGLEMEEPLTGNLVMNVKERDSDRIFRDDTVEVFIDPDGEGTNYFHLTFNPAGAVRDSRRRGGMPRAGDSSFNSRVEAAVHVSEVVGEDKWTVEMKVPAEALGAVVRDGDRWKMDVGRVRKAGGEPEEASTWMDGSFHNPDSFRNIVFSSPIIANGRFEEIFVMDSESRLRRRRSNWEYLNDPPANAPGWTLNNSTRGIIKIVDENTFSGSYSLQISAQEGNRAEVYTWMNAELEEGDRLNISFAARGEGSLSLGMRYYARRDPETGERGVFVDPASGRERSYASRGLDSFDLGGEWEKHEFSFTQPAGYPGEAMLLFSTSGGPFILDDVHVSIE